MSSKDEKTGAYARVSALVHEWLELHKGETFDLDTICRQLQIYERDNRRYTSIILARIVEQHKLDKHNKIYRYIDNTKEYINWLDNSNSKPIDIRWPRGRGGVKGIGGIGGEGEEITKFGFDGCVCISPGDIIVVAGVSNMGKSCFAQNFLFENMDNYPCLLMGNEYTPDKFRRRISRMTWGNPLREDGKPKFELVNRRENHKDIIEPDWINIIDWINMSDNFYQIGMIIEGIQSKLKNGIAMIVLQKGEGQTLGTGGQWSEHLSSLYLVIDSKRLTVRKAKEWFERDPNGKIYGFEITNGGTEFRNIRELVRCYHCHGTGQYKGQDCYNCLGQGYNDKEKK